jgi:hypothetical protein
MDDVLEGRLLNAAPSPEGPDDVPFLGNTARGLPPPVLRPSFRQSGIGWTVLDQHTSGTCGGQAGIGLRSWQELREGHPIDKFSAFALYDLCLEHDGTPDPDHERMKGTTAKTVMTVLRDKGTPLSSPPGGFAGKIASSQKLTELTEDAVKEAILTTGVVLARLDWDVEWTESNLLPGRILPDPSSEKGGHIFLLFGWDDDVNHGSFLMRNSWGEWRPKPGPSPTPKKAGRGNAYMHYGFLLDPARKAEIWTSVDVLRGPLPSG